MLQQSERVNNEEKERVRERGREREETSEP